MEIAIDRKLQDVFEQMDVVFSEVKYSRERIVGFIEYLKDVDASELQLAMKRCSNLEDYSGKYGRNNSPGGKKGNFEKSRDHFRHPVNFYITYNPNLGMMNTDRGSIPHTGRRSLEYSVTARPG